MLLPRPGLRQEEENGVVPSLRASLRGMCHLAGVAGKLGGVHKTPGEELLAPSRSHTAGGGQLSVPETSPQALPRL